MGEIQQPRARRASLHHVLRDLVLEGRIAVAEAGRGRNPTRYRRL